MRSLTSPRRTSVTCTCGVSAKLLASARFFTFGVKKFSVLRQPFVEPIDELRHRLELVRDDADAVLAEVLRLDSEGVRDTGDDVVRRNRTIAVDDVVEVASREIGLDREAAVRRAGL